MLKLKPAPGRPVSWIHHANILYLYTDGSCYPNPGPGGWGYVALRNGEAREAYGSAEYTTNNEMELTAILRGLQTFAKSRDIIILTDSQYAKNCITVWSEKWREQGWLTRFGDPIKNGDVVRQIMELWKPTYKVVWVKGHTGLLKYNERADHLAGQGREEAKRKLDEKYGPR